MEIKEQIKKTIQEEIKRLTAIIDDGGLTETELDYSYDIVLNYLDETYRHKKNSDVSICLIELRNIVNLIEYEEDDLITRYENILEYLGREE